MYFISSSSSGRPFHTHQLDGMFFLKAVINKTAASLGCYLTPVEEALLCVTQWLLISFSVACVAHPVAG